jgi:hypothetical protein
VIVAVLNGQLARATSGARASCPECGNAVTARIPEHAIRHWAHMPLAGDEDRGCSNEPGEMSEWHRHWQWLRTDLSCIEVARGAHRADAINEAGDVIEFQHSSISPEDIESRERFWRRGVWVLDGTPRENEERVEVRRRPDQPVDDPYCSFKWNRAHQLLYRADWPCWIDLGERFDMVQVRSAAQGRGNGWLVSREWFIKEVLNGGRRTYRNHIPRAVIVAKKKRQGTARPETEADLVELIRPCDRPSAIEIYSACSGCGHPLWAPVSQARGYCEQCRIHRGEPMAPYDWRAVS